MHVAQSLKLQRVGTQAGRHQPRLPRPLTALLTPPSPQSEYGEPCAASCGYLQPQMAQQQQQLGKPGAAAYGQVRSRLGPLPVGYSVLSSCCPRRNPHAGFCGRRGIDSSRGLPLSLGVCLELASNPLCCCLTSSVVALLLAGMRPRAPALHAGAPAAGAWLPPRPC